MNNLIASFFNSFIINFQQKFHSGLVPLNQGMPLKTALHICLVHQDQGTSSKMLNSGRVGYKSLIHLQDLRNDGIFPFGADNSFIGCRLHKPEAPVGVHMTGLHKYRIGCECEPGQMVTTNSWYWLIVHGLIKTREGHQLLCISTSKQVLRTPFTVLCLSGLNLMEGKLNKEQWQRFPPKPFI